MIIPIDIIQLKGRNKQAKYDDDNNNNNENNEEK